MFRLILGVENPNNWYWYIFFKHRRLAIIRNTSHHTRTAASTCLKVLQVRVQDADTLTANRLTAADAVEQQTDKHTTFFFSSRRNNVFVLFISLLCFDFLPEKRKRDRSGGRQVPRCLGGLARDHGGPLLREGGGRREGPRDGPLDVHRHEP